MKLFIGGQRWSIYLVPPKSKFLRGSGKHVSSRCDYKTCASHLNGRCEYSKCRIYVMKEGAVEDTLLHELLHAMMFVSGADKIYDGDPVKEERLVTALTPTLHRLLKDLGLKFPLACA